MRIKVRIGGSRWKRIEGRRESYGTTSVVNPWDGEWDCAHEMLSVPHDIRAWRRSSQEEITAHSPSDEWSDV